jgi:hypothetical protein
MRRWWRGGRRWRGGRIGRWQWGGVPYVFDALEPDVEGWLSIGQLERALGRRGLRLLADETGEPVPRAHWDGTGAAFTALDGDGDGFVDDRDLRRGLGRAATDLALDGVPPGPALPDGAEFLAPHGGGVWVTFPGREAKAAYMAAAPARDARDPNVIKWVRQFTRLPPEQRAAAILRFCQLSVRYQRDPAWFDREGRRHGIEVLESSGVTLARGYGDCDAKTRLFLTLCLLCGVPARLAPVFTGEDGFPHVRAEVLQTTETGGEAWEVADPSIVNSRIGHVPAHVQTHVPQFRWTSRGEQVSTDDGNTWRAVTRPRERETGNGEPSGVSPAQGSARDQPPAASPPPAAVQPATPDPATPAVVAARWGPYKPHVKVYVAGHWYEAGPTGRIGPERLLPQQPPPPPRDKMLAQLNAARRHPRPHPPRPHRHRPHAARPGESAPPASMLPSQIPAVLQAVQTGIGGATSVAQSISGIVSAFSGAGDPSEAGASRNANAGAGALTGLKVGAAAGTVLEAVPVFGPILHGAAALFGTIAGAIAGAGRDTFKPTPEHAEQLLTLMRIDPGLIFAGIDNATTPEQAARLARYLKLVAGEHPLPHGITDPHDVPNPNSSTDIAYMIHPDPMDPLTDPAYLQHIHDTVFGTKHQRHRARYLAAQPLVVTADTAQRLLAILRHGLVQSGVLKGEGTGGGSQEHIIPGHRRDIAGQIRRVRTLAGESGRDERLEKLFGHQVNLPELRAA